MSGVSTVVEILSSKGVKSRDQAAFLNTRLIEQRLPTGR